MADFTTLRFQLNTGTNGAPVWTAAGTTAASELRFSDVSTAGATASASWPFMTRPAATGGVDYLYVATADAVLLGCLGTSSSTPTAFTNASYRQFRFDWDNLGTYASAPIYTAYPTTAHGAISRGDASLLGGHVTDTGATARSYLKGNAFGRVDTGGVPAASPAAAPTVTMGTTGTVSPVAGANWLAAGQGDWQGLMGDTDFITAPFTPAATTADQWSLMIRLFTGPNMAPSTYTNDVSLKYTYT